MKNYLMIGSLLLFAACDTFLDVKPNKAIDTPDSLESVEALLDNASTMNYNSTLSVVLGDEFYADETAISSMELLEQNFYLWTPRPLQPDELVFDWRDRYNQIQIANVCLESLQGLPDGLKKNELTGTALFFRAHAYFSLSTLFLEGPNLENTGLELKIPIRKSTSMVLKPELATRQAIRDLIREDLDQAVGLLPTNPSYLSRPSKQAAYALMARVFLDWEDYETAKDAAGKVIEMGGELMDFNELDPSNTYPIPSFNSEIIWLARIGGTSYFNSQSGFQMSPELLGLYSEEDLRASMFYVTRSSGFINFRGSYLSGRPVFGGLSLNEAYLIYAESLVRTGELEEGEKMLSYLLERRMVPGWEGIEFSNETDALGIILKERRKELPFRGLRWSDLRRINKDDRFQTILVREFEGTHYQLTPESEKYVLPVPARELSFY
ncbi:RagB/SusD family nutrient uptake outer membrane protein [Algoriphagus halophytocola]|uniref:RagB/SusD family nutrient uptake outer membrane protein n=1 Tax=Algoriphagus halophytocola TaxID=2991499 RepID=A0ABY6ML69_9BACT|nr:MULTISPECIES: RagB/SusD family nutrient uptake outer membrane protein [unclassified Algoriphagus]UZD23923.1 RagB/SusD family nutrient uptake outer membrane protein [Algoriphagus sp. TR-M5]WBL41291.1 RagB/SusD family nutrient uptake outer membrane protein [Algoriphagus sp. TR-M9]